MRAQFVNENIRFERGQDPKDSMEIGHWSIKRALLDQPPLIPGTMEADAAKEWWKKGGIPPGFKKEIGYSENWEDFISFDEDYYLENEVPEWVDYDEFHGEFHPIGPRKNEPNTRGRGLFQWQRGKLPDGTIVYHYQDGMGSGYIARRDQIKGDK
jgi:hypothetical protein